MKILLVYPEYPATFWSFKYALRFISKKAAYPPLGLLTVAALLPAEWEKKLVDMNVKTLDDRDLLWADYVFISAMTIQRNSADMVIRRCKKLGIKIVAGGPHFTTNYEEYSDVDHLVLGEAEVTLPYFLKDLKKKEAKHLYTSHQRADITTTPVPLWELIDMKQYASMNIQYSRGCPFDCEFCVITILYGHTPRTKTKEQIITELESLYSIGWRGRVFIVDDNFIGNKVKLKKEILPAIIWWVDKRNYPFKFSTEVSINLSDDEELIRLMVQAGFDEVFVGIETPDEEGLEECGKFQNKNRDLKASVEKLQNSGLEVSGGFIVGFDSDTVSTFRNIVRFIRETSIVVAMVGLLNAPRDTKLYKRLKKEGRLLKDMTGDNTDLSTNFITKMNFDILINEYKEIIRALYLPKYYYKRITRFLNVYKPLQKRLFRFSFKNLQALCKSILFLGIIGKERVYYWRLFLWTIFKRPQLFPLAITYSIYGLHFRKIFKDILMVTEDITC